MPAGHRVTKVIDFCYGHRLLRYSGKCRFLHGHNGRLEVDLTAGDLDDMGMVMDFGEIQSRVKRWVDENLDHRMVLCEEDPAVPILKEMGEPVYCVPWNPTAENISQLIFQQALAQGLPVTEVRLWETPSSYASYAGAPD